MSVQRVLRAGLVAGAILLGLAPLTAWALTGPHDFNTSETSPTPQGQVCIACHTPHKAPNSALLWNHTLSANNFSWSDWTQTTGGTNLPTNITTWSGSSKMCLSCHDGTVAIGSIYANPATVFNPSRVTGSEVITTGGAGNDLKGTHPVAVPYPYNGVRNTYNGIVTGELALQSGWVANPTNVKLFLDPRTSGSNNRGIECSSCHDAHGTAYPKYLRNTLQGSAICLSCHVK